jgi:hypothetical protein
VDIYFHNFTELSRLAEATIPVTEASANAEITFSCPGIVMLLFSAMFHNSMDWTSPERKKKNSKLETNEHIMKRVKCLTKHSYIL